MCYFSNNSYVLSYFSVKRMMKLMMMVIVVVVGVGGICDSESGGELLW